MRPNNICCIGGNYLGGLLSCVIASKCPEVRVTVLDKEETIQEWNYNENLFREPGLSEILKKCRNRNLFFSSNYGPAIGDADMVIISVNIPIITKITFEKKTLDFSKLEEATKVVAFFSESDKIIVEKSNVSARAVNKISAILRKHGRPGVRFQVLSNPEFITKGSAVNDLLYPKCILIGCQKNPVGRAAAQSLAELYEQWIPRKNIIIIHNWSAEISKLASNAFLAQKMCSFNTLAVICENTAANFPELSNILTKDPMIGPNFTHVFLGIGGTQKDLWSLIMMCEALRLPEVASYWKAVLDLNNYLIDQFTAKIKSLLESVPETDKDVTVLGFSNAKNSFDTNNSPAIAVCGRLLAEGFRIKIYDPAVAAKQIFEDLKIDEKDNRVQVCTDASLAINGSSAIIVCTDWEEFLQIEYGRVVKWMKSPIIIDGFSCLHENSFKDLRVKYYTTGRHDSPEKIPRKNQKICEPSDEIHEKPSGKTRNAVKLSK